MFPYIVTNAMVLNNLQLTYVGEVLQIRRNWPRERISVQPAVQTNAE